MDEEKAVPAQVESKDQTGRKHSKRKKKHEVKNAVIARTAISKSKLSASVAPKKVTLGAMLDAKAEVLDLCDDEFINQSFAEANKRSLELLLDQSVQKRAEKSKTQLQLPSLKKNIAKLPKISFKQPKINKRNASYENSLKQRSLSPITHSQQFFMSNHLL